VDLRAATDLGIIVANVPDYCVHEVADQTLSMILALIRKTVFFDQKVKSGQWDFRQGRPITESGVNPGPYRDRKDRP
jgi:D-3-phosphoglycerate dehydrogenase